MPSRRLLVVDDEPLIRQTLQMCLRDEYDVTTAASGEEAIALVQHEDFPVVILDLCMEGLSGIETLKRLKEIREMQNVIILTAYESTETAIAALNYGAFNYLTKPFDRGHLKAVISRGFDDYEQQTLRDREMQQRVMSVHDNFFSLLCHEFNTPLNIIMGFSELLSQELRDDEQMGWARDIRESGEHLHDILMEIVDYVSASHLATAGVSNEFVVPELLGGLTDRFKDKDVTVHYVDLSDGPQRLVGADKSVLMVARKMVSMGSHQSPSVRLTSFFEVGEEGSEGSLRLVVDETGLLGEAVSRVGTEALFEPYRMAGSTTFPRGLGLELATCRKIAEYAGGSVDCSVRADGEVQFVAQIPVKRVGS